MLVRFGTDRAGRLSSVAASFNGSECASKGLPISWRLRSERHRDENWDLPRRARERHDNRPIPKERMLEQESQSFFALLSEPTAQPE